MEIVVEGIRPEHDLTWLVWRRVFDPPGRGGAPSPHRRYPPPEPFPECLPRKCRNLPLPRHSGNLLGNIPQQGRLRCKIHQPRRNRRPPSPDVTVAKSTPTGQSLLQPLQERHRSSESFTSSLCHPSRTTSPLVISQSRCARPRVECSSSRVTRKLGHITPPSWCRHFPTPTQRWVARTRLP